MLKDNKNNMERNSLSSKPQFLMCPPNFFKVVGPNQQGEFFNDQSKVGWHLYHKNPDDYLKKAFEQWHLYKQTLQDVFQAEILLVEPAQDLSDQVFTADATLSLVHGKERICLMSQFTHPQRQREVKYHEAVLNQFPITQKVQMSAPFEGAGDNVYDPFRDIYWSGYTEQKGHPAAGRSDKEAHALLKETTGVCVVSIQLMRPFFHVDTCLTALSKGHLMVYRGGMDAKSYETVVREGLYEYGLDPKDYLIEVTKQEALEYACNLVNVGRQVVMPRCGDRISSLLKQLGYDVHQVDLSMFIGAGGGPHCLINYINQPRYMHPRNQEQRRD